MGYGREDIVGGCTACLGALLSRIRKGLLYLLSEYGSMGTVGS